MVNIDISSDIDKAMRSVDVFFRKQIPFATAGALTSTAFDVRKRVVGSTYPKAFTVRNRAYPGRLWRVRKASKKTMEATVYQTLDRGYIEKHITGGTKKSHTGGDVAIPVNIKRSKNGRIPANRKPRRLMATGKSFIKKGRGGKKLIMTRVRNKTRVDYVLSKSANIRRSFRFYEDSFDTTFRVFSGHWNHSMNKAIHTSRFR